MYIVEKLDELFCRHWLGPLIYGMIRSRISLLIFCLDDLSIGDRGVLRYPTIIVLEFFMFFSFIIHMCIQGLRHFSPLPAPPPLPPTLTPPSPLTPSIPSRNYFALISNFVVERV
jgi:hypothetical protein